MKTIEIDGVCYSLDVEKSMRDGYLKRELEFRVGGVYTDPKREINPFLLVQALYVNPDVSETIKAYALLGRMGGFAANSEMFFRELHTKDEILKYLNDRGMVYSCNAAKAIKD